MLELTLDVLLPGKVAVPGRGPPGGSKSAAAARGSMMAAFSRTEAQTLVRVSFWGWGGWLAGGWA